MVAYGGTGARPSRYAPDPATRAAALVAALEGALAAARAVLDELDVARQHEATGGPARERPLPHPASAGLRPVQGGGEAPPTTGADACRFRWVVR